MVKVKSYKGLMAALSKARDEALAGAAKEAEQLVKDRIDEDVYGVGTPEEYQRTYQLRDSIKAFKVEKKGDTSQVKIAHDTSLIHPNVENFQHASTYWSPWNYVNYVAETVHDGTSGGLFGDGYWRQPRPYMFNARNEMIDGKYRQFMIEQLKSQGYKVK